MSNFVKVPVNKHALSQRGFTYSVGINDAPYMTQRKINGKNVKCPAYRKWFAMLERCYCPKLQAKYNTYIGCTVCDEWLTFSNFAEWYELNNVDGYQLDKDIKFKGNKVYSPKTCLFVPSVINSLLTASNKSRGEFPLGVHYNKLNKCFGASVRVDGKAHYIGRFDSSDDAHNAYCIAKNIEIKRKMVQYPLFSMYLEQHMVS